jgi:hypothetical protein
MYKALVAIGVVASLSGCAGTSQNAATAAEDCRTVAQDNTDSHIKVRRDCNSTADAPAPAPLGTTAS